MTGQGTGAGAGADFSPARLRLSPNAGARRAGARATILVLHYTGMATGTAAEDWLCSTQSGVSSHYLVHEDGAVVQMVPEARRAWHAGRSHWRGTQDVNSASIGIEIANGGHEAGLPGFPDTQIAALTALCRDIVGRHAIAANDVVGHSDIAPGRKRDPGEAFPWQRLAEAGIGLWVEPAPVAGGRFFSRGDSGEPVAALQSMLALYGFDATPDGVFGRTTEIQLEAFQRRFRPARVDGVADMSTIDTLNRLLRLYPRLS
ncbi:MULTISPECIES: N-acetylmuramoyl-L-alanine amidase [unclassified Roseitalea]|uniref:peptidoglycan recognition protein family protein n=1 Tax=unclassified Roseitalea TaxID=2639107 RepID=UPI00273F89ED|nr:MULTISPECIES: N-acetylmuramoyl-L-alanine amidase [unclassified Roseitalea]